MPSLLESLIIFVCIFFAGFVDSMAGGGGLVSIPTYLATGIPAELLLGTNKTVSTISKSLTITRFIKNKKIDFSFVWAPIICAFIGSFIGSNLSSILDSKSMVYLLIFIIPIVFMLNFIKRFKQKRRAKKGLDVPVLSKSSILMRSAIIGLVIGSYDGFFGPGTGTFLILALTFFLHMDIIKAAPNAGVINFTSNVSAFMVFLFSGKIHWPVVLIALPAGLLGNYFGSGQVLKGNDKVVQLAFNCVLAGLLLKSIYSVFFAN